MKKVYENPRIPVCARCVHYIKRFLRAPRCGDAVEYSFITGREWPAPICLRVRKSEALCGHEGRWYEPAGQK